MILLLLIKGKIMTKNLGKIDRIIRIIIGLIILALGFMNDSLYGLIGLVPLLTAILGWCPLYCPFKIKTCSKSECEK